MTNEDMILKLNIPIKTWYRKNYPNDVIGKTLSQTTSFLDLNNLLNSGRGYEVYSLLGGDADSIIRERCFEKLCELTHQDYGDIYDKWVYSKRNIDIEEEMEKEW